MNDLGPSNRSSKLKAQSSRETPSTNGESRIAPGDRRNWWEDEESSEPMALRDGPAASPPPHPWDLEERTSVFGERVIRFAKRIPRGPGNDRVIDQLVGAATSVGANYCEANQAVSKKDFRFTVSRCVKEAKETKFFLRMVVASEPQLADEARPLYREAHELLRIFGSMRNK